LSADNVRSSVWVVLHLTLTPSILFPPGLPCALHPPYMRALTDGARPVVGRVTIPGGRGRGPLSWGPGKGECPYATLRDAARSFPLPFAPRPPTPPLLSGGCWSRSVEDPHRRTSAAPISRGRRAVGASMTRSSPRWAHVISWRRSTTSCVGPLQPPLTKVGVRGFRGQGGGESNSPPPVP
jgi:hypothetical protein